jgi:hypothetical protein
VQRAGRDLVVERGGKRAHVVLRDLGDRLHAAHRVDVRGVAAAFGAASAALAVLRPGVVVVGNGYRRRRGSVRGHRARINGEHVTDRIARDPPSLPSRGSRVDADPTASRLSGFEGEGHARVAAAVSSIVDSSCASTAHQRPPLYDASDSMSFTQSSEVTSKTLKCCLTRSDMTPIIAWGSCSRGPNTTSRTGRPEAHPRLR